MALKRSRSRSFSMSAMPEYNAEVVTNKPKNESTPYMDSFGTDLAQINVDQGNRMKIFHVYKKKLCDKIPHFNQLFEGNHDPFVELPDISPSTFDVLVEWVYTDCLRGIEIVKASDSDHKSSSISWNPVELCILAERLLLTGLMDRVMEVVRKLDRSEDVYYNHKTLKLIYMRTFLGSNIRQYVTQNAAYAVRNFDKSSSLSTTHLLYVMEEHTDFAHDYLDITRTGNLEDPREGPGCQFHVHREHEECPVPKYMDDGKITIREYENGLEKTKPSPKKPRLPPGSQRKMQPNKELILALDQNSDYSTATRQSGSSSC
ncbi:800102ff-70ec-4de3-b9d6-de3eaf6115dc [Sclerotinia trifoliorum]|uniref:800102ff-70ec-4de3-b9d6-de3eaf6115dc n=1 Tax=Sclerotinia trifoliorum TaxID=28548 RepID=A0A8H2W1C8_9HELO|nr:800102ff-70ec-4de3-b9d6-de3eaf6115dc [Sclerotinia trifoliorum]